LSACSGQAFFFRGIILHALTTFVSLCFARAIGPRPA
jgi:hypothetical protein